MSRRSAQLPRRPSIPLALWVLVATIACERLVFMGAFAVRDSGLPGAFLPALGAGEALVLLAAGALRAQHRLSRDACAVLVALSLAAGMGAFGAGMVCHRLNRSTAALQSTPISSCKIEVVSDASPSPRGYRHRSHVLTPRGTSCQVWLKASRPFERGTVISCVGRYASLSDDDFGRSSWSQGICGTIGVNRVLSKRPRGGFSGLIDDLRRRAICHVGTASAPHALLLGCLCAYRTPLEDQGLIDLFSCCGISHLIAVSGAHLALLSSLISMVLAVAELGPRTRFSLLALITGAFVCFCGLPLSAVRAWLMSLAAFGAQLAGRRSHALSAVCVAALCMALVDPCASSQLGFLLSITSVVALCILSPHATYLLRTLLPCLTLPRRLGRRTRMTILKVGDGIINALAATLVCQLATLPLTLETFGTLSLVAPLANILMLPVMGAVVPLGALSLLVWWFPALNRILMAVCDACLDVVLACLHGLASLPLASVSLAWALPWISLLASAVLVAWVILWPQLSQRTLRRAVCLATLICLALLFRWRLLAPARMVVLDVGQGDVILVQEGATAVLIDAGPRGALTEALARNHVLHLDAIVLTHLHDDHYGGLHDLPGTLPCDKIFVADGVATHVEGELGQACRDLTGEEPHELSYGDRLVVGDFTLRMVWPRVPVDGSENAHSIELLLTYQHHDASLSALLTGDAERDETGACLAEGDVGDIDVLKIGHHGSEASLTPDEARALSAEVAIASAGEGNSYGHPHQECVEVLETSGATVLCTKDAGDIDVRPSPRGPLVRLRSSKRTRHEAPVGVSRQSGL